MRPAGRIVVSIIVSAAFSALLPAAARAGGYDTPMLYSARHMGMGGTAVGFVSEPSAIFHNPAGLAHTQTMSVTGDVSVLLAKVRSSPGISNPDVESEQTTAPLFLLGGGLRLNDIMTVGLGVYPIALAGATYRYVQGGVNIEDRTRLVFLEASPAFALNLPGRVRLGAGYRVTYVSVTRFKGDPAAAAANLDFQMDGLNWLGLRAGAQWTPVDWLQVGVVYRHKTKTKVTNDQGTALGFPFADIETNFVLPTKFGAGARADFWHLGLALDGEYLLNSQNDGYPLVGTPPPTEPGMAPTRLAVDNVFDWKDEIVVRAGVELRFGFVRAIERLSLRGGFIHDGKTTNPQYPSPFGTPPGPTRVVTAGLGWNGGAWQVNAAFARRFGTGEVTEADLSAPDRRRCSFCGFAGMLPYKIDVNGFYLDFSYAY